MFIYRLGYKIPIVGCNINCNTSVYFNKNVNKHNKFTTIELSLSVKYLFNKTEMSVMLL